MNEMNRKCWAGIAAALVSALLAIGAGAADAPRIVEKDGRHALIVDGKPFLMLGGQIHNSSAWPVELGQVWESAAALHANTIEAPIYWEQFEPQPGRFDTTNIDALVKGARAHNLRLVLLWFGTWKNGNMHYVPSWVKTDTKRFPRTIRPDGEPIDVLSPIGRATLAADKAAFVALANHLKKIDGDQHTVLMVQVENEAGNIGSVRDNSPEANALFAGPVPADLLAAAHKSAGTWKEVFGGAADETFQVYYQAKYINEIAAAGKAVFNIPYSVNVWVAYPPAALAQRQLDQPGIGYPSGGAVQKMLGLWKALAPSIDVIGPDIYGDGRAFVDSLLQTYARADNALMIPEIGRSDNFSKVFYKALGHGAIGFAPFGIDRTGWNILGDEKWTGHPRNFQLFAPMSREIAQLEFDGKVKTAVEEVGEPSQEVDFGEWQATVAYGFPQRDGETPPGTKDAHGAAFIAQLGPDEFLVTGLDASVIFHLKDKKPWMRSQFLTVEQGTFEKGVWKPLRLWNGDETDRGLSFHQEPEVVRVKMQKF
jgi:hypothetical protein